MQAVGMVIRPHTCVSLSSCAQASCMRAYPLPENRPKCAMDWLKRFDAVHIFPLVRGCLTVHCPPNLSAPVSCVRRPNLTHYRTPLSLDGEGADWVQYNIGGCGLPAVRALQRYNRFVGVDRGGASDISLGTVAGDLDSGSWRGGFCPGTAGRPPVGRHQRDHGVEPPDARRSPE
jgi:hypothetical protein